MGDSIRKVNDGMDASSHSPGHHPGWGGGDAPAAGVGASLREARQRLGVELRDVAEMLRIRYVFLQAIEDGRYADLPGNAYAAGFLRSYAEYLGMDADAVVRRFKDEVAGRTVKQELYFPTPVPEGRVPGGAVLLAALVIAGSVYGGWYYLSATDRSMVDLVPALPDRLVSLLDNLPFSATTQPSLPAPEDTAADAPPVAVAPPADAPPAEAPRAEDVAPAPPAPAVVAEAPAPAPAPEPAPAAAPAPPPPAPPAATAPAAGAASPARAPELVPGPSAAAPPATSTPAAPAPSASPATPGAVTPAPLPPATAPDAVAALPAVPPAEPADAAEEETEEAAQEPTPLTPEAAPLPAVAAEPGSTAAADAAAAVATPPTRVYGSQNQESRVQLRATQDSWVQVRDGGGDLLFTRVLRPGEVYRVPDRPGVRLRTGNAGGLVVVVDGVAGAPLGASGQVLRDIALDAPTLR